MMWKEFAEWWWALQGQWGYKLLRTHSLLTQLRLKYDLIQQKEKSGK